MEELKVSLENIIPLTYARDHFSQIVGEVQKDKLFILTKGGVPAVAIMDVKYLETITGGGIKKEEIQEEIKKAPEQVGLPKMVEHPPPPPSPAQPSAIPPVPPVKTPSQPAGFAAPQAPAPKETTPPLDSSIPSTAPKPSPPPQNPPKTTSNLQFPKESKTNDQSKIDIQFSPDEMTLKKDTQAEKTPDQELTMPDDKNSPAQYSGEKDTEPEDMAID